MSPVVLRTRCLKCSTPHDTDIDGLMQFIFGEHECPTESQRIVIGLCCDACIATNMPRLTKEKFKELMGVD